MNSELLIPMFPSSLAECHLVPAGTPNQRADRVATATCTTRTGPAVLSVGPRARESLQLPGFDFDIRDYCDPQEAC